METRVALIGIIVEEESSVAALNELLHRYHVRVDQPEFAVRIGKIRSPDATG